MTVPLDHNKLRLRVFEQTGIKLGNDDPIFALVALNDAVLEETYGRHAALIEDATRKLRAQAKKLEQTGGPIGQAQTGPDSDDADTDGGFDGEDEARQPPSPSATPAGGAASIDWRWLAGIGASGVLSAVLVLCGLWLFGGPSSWSRQPVQAQQQAQAATPSLSAEQQALLQNAEKLNKIVQKLDGKTKSLIRAEMQKQ